MKKGKKSSNFGEIIKKLYFFFWWKVRQRATHATPHLSASRYLTFYTWWTASANRKCKPQVRDLLKGFTRRGWGGGRAG